MLGQLLTVNGRLLSGAYIVYGRKTMQPKDAQWDMIDTTFSKGAQVKYWAWVLVKDGSEKCSQNRGEVEKYVTEFKQALNQHGVSCPNPYKGQELILRDAKRPDEEIKKFFEGFTWDDAQAPRLLLVLLPSNSTAIYNSIKRAADISSGVQTVSYITSKLAKDRSIQYFTNIALKVNLKFDGQNQVLKPTSLSFVSEGHTMVVGMDVTHPAPGSVAKAPSVSTIVASVDSTLSTWPADINLQSGRKEMFEGLKEMFKGHIKLWQKHNRQQLPE